MGVQILKEMQATREKGVYLFVEKYIFFFKKVLSFDGKSTIVLPKKYYRFLREGLSYCNRLTVS